MKIIFCDIQNILKANFHIKCKPKENWISSQIIPILSAYRTYNLTLSIPTTLCIGRWKDFSLWESLEACVTSRPSRAHRCMSLLCSKSRRRCRHVSEIFPSVEPCRLSSHCTYAPFTHVDTILTETYTVQSHVCHYETRFELRELGKLN